MIITFLGHSDYSETPEHKKLFLDFLEDKVGDKPALFYLGGYGAFDCFAKRCCLEYKEKHPNVKLIKIIPYLDREVNMEGYDESLYPPLESVPKKLAISRRNVWMIEQADYIIAYVWHFGGARNSLDVAKQKKKVIYNLADIKR